MDVQGVRDRPMCRLLGWLLTVGNGTPQSSADVCLEVSLGRRTFRMHVDADPRASCRPCGRCLGSLSIPGGINVEALSIGRVMPAARSRDNEGGASGRRGRWFDKPDWTRPYQQYTYTPGGSYGCTALADAGDHEPFAVAIETPYDHGGHHRDH